MEFFLEKFKSFKKGLFVFSDPGGALPILSFVSLLKKNNPIMDLTVVSDRKYDFYTKFNNVFIIEDIDIWLKKEHNYDYVLTGTSYTSNLEIRILKWAVKQNIKTFSYIDYWTNIKDRFKYQGNYIIPNRVLVIDKKAKEIAINEGIERKRVKVVNNPYHSYLKDWSPKEKKKDFFTKLQLVDLKKKVITYAPDSVSNHNWITLYGVDESTILEEILDAFIEMEHLDFHFLIQPHPNQNINLLQKILDKKKFKNNSVKIISKIDVPLLLYFSDIIIGQFSNILIEASIFNKSIIRYIPEQMKDYMQKKVGKKVKDKTMFKTTFLNLFADLNN